VLQDALTIPAKGIQDKMFYEEHKKRKQKSKWFNVLTQVPTGGQALFIVSECKKMK
jgi:hypothetical protein